MDSDSDNVTRIPWTGRTAQLSDDDEHRRDTQDLAAMRCGCDRRGALMGPAGRYVDLYVRSGLPTGALAFALVAIGLSYLASTAWLIYQWALELYARFGQAGVSAGGLM